MSKFEAELRLPCKQPYAYISVWIRGESITEMEENLHQFDQAGFVNSLTMVHTSAYDIVMGVAPKATPEQLITSELGGKVIEEQPVEKKASITAAAEGQKPWERKKPAAKADPNDPFANFK